MIDRLIRRYYGLTVDRPWLAIGLVAVVLAAAATQIRHFQLDASAESLVIEGDETMQYYREIRARYGSDDFLIVTWTPESELFADATLARLEALRDELARHEAVASVLSILDVPLLESPPVSLSEIQRGTRTLLEEDTDRELAREEFRTSPIYGDLLMNQDADTAALVVMLERDEEARALLSRRDELRVKRAEEGLTEAERAELERVSEQYAALNERLQAELEKVIDEVRAILDRHRDNARIHLGGVPMIAVDMIDFVRGDIKVFGIGVAVFIIALLALSFRELRWVLVPSLICAGVVVGMVGFIGFMSWPVTVVSSNFISLVLILTLSLIVHLVVRYREIHGVVPGVAPGTLMRRTVASKFKPSVFTAGTTMVAFGSMLFADIRPIMDFGLMMVCAVAFALVLTFVLFPALVMPWAPRRPPAPRRDLTARVTTGLFALVRRRAAAVWLVFAAITVLAVAGIARLSVENRFIDYFKPSTEIYQGMALIDRELGGTTPLDVVLDAPADLRGDDSDETPADAGNGDAPAGDLDLFEDLDELGAEDAPEGPFGGYWFTSFQLETVDAIHSYLERLPETGKVLSLATSMRVLTQLNGGQPLDGFALAVAYERMPDELRAFLFDPYLSDDGKQTRFDIRVISDPNLQRDALLRQIRDDLTENFDLEPGQVNLSGMLVLYNNVMQSLLGSLYTTMLTVFGAMLLMFGFLFRSLKMAVIGPTPTLIAALAVLGMMGLIGLPLDIMTMTIAAITIGIGVDDTIHYTDRFEQEIREGRGYEEAIAESHLQVGRAMIYTTVIIAGGFSILTLSNFMPTIYFGLLTGVAMVFALLINLTLLPLLLRWLRPFAAAAEAAPAGVLR